MYRANLRGANLEEANLIGAGICGTDLRKANLKGAKITNLDRCTPRPKLEGAIMPDGTIYKEKK